MEPQRPRRNQPPKSKYVYRANTTPRPHRQPPRPHRPPSTVEPAAGLWKKLLSDLLFFAALLGIVVGLGVYKQLFRQGARVLDYSFFTVLSGSMQRDIPVGSLIIVKSLPPDQLQPGDDITYLRDAGTVITHRIVEVSENWDENGGRAFVTQGIENPMPDEKPVHQANVVGKVVQVLPGVGLVLSYIGSHLKWVLLLMALLFALITSLRIFAQEQKQSRGKNKIPCETL